jgi:hypothetical protein
MDYNKLPPFFTTLPYTNGNTKGRHYYCRVIGIPKWDGTQLNVFKDFIGDLIGVSDKSCNVWEKINGKIYNYFKSLPSLNYKTTIYPMLKPHVADKHRPVLDINDECVFDIDDESEEEEYTVKKKIKKVKEETIIDGDGVKKKVPIKAINIDKNIIEKKKLQAIIKNEDMSIKLVKDESVKTKEYNNKYKETKFTHDDIKNLSNMLSENRINNYDSWLALGACLYNINKIYVLLWDEISKKGNSYELEACEKKWKTFKKGNLHVGSLLYWAKMDNKDAYKEFWKNKKVNNIILSKYPNENFILGETKIINKNLQHTYINLKKCLIKGDAHENCAKFVVHKVSRSRMFWEIISFRAHTIK